MRILKRDGTEYIVDINEIKDYERLFPGVDVRHQIELAARWCLDNPSKRKDQIPRFLTNWLKRAPSTLPTSGPAGYRARVQEEHHKEMAKPAASYAVGRAALNEALRLVGKAALAK
ncbi:MAG: hypothetical protein FJ194_19660 [Gammaproteobacteria bacterium]|nr:hypothetical protein [Gammaproteobacteria bacterium]